MRKVIYDIDELIDSKDFLYFKSKKTIISFLIFLLISIAIIFSWISINNIAGEKKMRGILKVEEGEIILKSPAQGQLSEKLYTEGEKVNKGQLLISIDSKFDLDYLNSKKIEKEENEKIIEGLSNIKKSILEGTNYLNMDDGVYYLRFKKYQNTIDEESIETKSFLAEEQKLLDEKEKYKILKKSITDDENYFTNKECVQALKFDKFELDRVKSISSLSEDEKEVKKDIEIESLKNKYYIDIQKEMESLDIKLRNVSNKLIGKRNNESVENLKVEYSMIIDEEIKRIEKENKKIDLEKINVEKKINSTKIFAPINGWVESNRVIEVGDNITNDEEVIFMTPSEKKCLIQFYSEDIEELELKIGQNIKVGLQDEVQSGNRNINAEIVEINEIMRSNKKNYQILASIKETINDFELKDGMIGMANIKLKKQKLGAFFIEKVFKK